MQINYWAVQLNGLVLLYLRGRTLLVAIVRYGGVAPSVAMGVTARAGSYTSKLSIKRVAPNRAAASTTKGASSFLGCKSTWRRTAT